jgi:hypothetical protein
MHINYQYVDAHLLKFASRREAAAGPLRLPAPIPNFLLIHQILCFTTLECIDAARRQQQPMCPGGLQQAGGMAMIREGGKK